MVPDHGLGASEGKIVHKYCVVVFLSIYIITIYLLPLGWWLGQIYLDGTTFQVIVAQLKRLFGHFLIFNINEGNASFDSLLIPYYSNVHYFHIWQDLFKDSHYILFFCSVTQISEKECSFLDLLRLPLISIILLFYCLGGSILV